MTDNTEADFQPVRDMDVSTHFLQDSNIEIIGGFSPRRTPSFVLFDFDGTLSLIREGWPQVMVPMMVEFLRATGTRESDEELREICGNFVMELTGKQTIYQMLRLAEEVTRRDGTPLDPLAYKNEYHRRLMLRIESRREGLRSGAITPGEMLVPGSCVLLDSLRQRGIPLYLASGTDERYVKEEVELLQLDRYFDNRVYGALDDYRSFSKAQIINRILTGNQRDGATLLGFGDGYVEIQNVRQAGGTAVAVASDEARRSGRPDAWKRRRLIRAGAHVVVPDFRDAAPLVEWLC